MRGSGVENVLLLLRFGENTIEHVKCQAHARAVRAHIFIQTASVQLLVTVCSRRFFNFDSYFLLCFME